MSGTTQANPLISQGSLNRLRAALVVPSYPALNVTAPYLGREGISVNLEGEAVPYLPTLTGAVPSPEPYQMVRMRVALLKTQTLSYSYKSQYESNAQIGNVTVKADTSGFPNYTFNACSLVNITDLRFSGENADFMVEIRGFYIINASLFNPV